MSKIYASLSFKTDKWDVEISDLRPDSAELYMDFKNSKGNLYKFKDLTFYYRLSTKTGTVLQSQNYPPPGVTYVQSNESFIASEKLKLSQSTEYELYFRAQNNGRIHEKSVRFITPRNPQPFASWEWDNTEKKWHAPIPYPSDGNFYIWNEETVSWKQQDPNKASDE